MLVIAVLTLGVLLPAALLAWYTIGPGIERETRWRLSNLAARKPLKDAQKAAAKNDFRLLMIGGRDPGVDWTTDDHRDKYGYRNVPWIYGRNLTAEDARLNKTATDYAVTYNKIIFKEVQKSRQWPGS